MNLIRKFVKDGAQGVVIADDPEGLKAFMQLGCAAAVWRRHPEPHFQNWVNGLDPATLPRGRCVLHRTQVPAAVRNLCDIARTPQGPDRDRLVDDVTALSEIFSDLVRAPYMRLRLDAITTNACRKLHVDAITARLVCTYRGAGTQYGIAKPGADPARVFDTPTGAPILLRGTLWPATPASGLLHRSPPIEGTGETRLVLVLDPIFDRDDAI